ncbi:MAG: DNA translocase FtsK 4TM domain-containing protein [Clostridiales bacterium]|jgi:S-DNA-T family DNA segregation ATPase FtsK/SpoIIIE|nr:DNA translocase FtsK 4TM domain-containing protein [Clostridiales bacterium]
MAVQEIKDEIKQQIRAVILLALAALCFAALNFTVQTGEVGIFLNNVLRTLTGDVAILVPLVILIAALPWKLPNKSQRQLGFLLFVVILVIWAQMRMLVEYEDLVRDVGIYRASFQLGYQQLGGGVVGAFFSVVFYFLFRDIGSQIVLTALAVISFLLITNHSLIQLFTTLFACIRFAGRTAFRACMSAGSIFKFLFSSYTDEGECTAELSTDKAGKKRKKKPIPENSSSVPTDTVDILSEPAVEVSLFGEPLSETVPIVSAKEAPLSNGDNPLIVEVNERPPGISIVPPLGDYELPPLSLLSKVPRLKDSQQQKTIAERSRILEQTLESFGVKVKVVAAQTGPTVTRFELQPESGVKVSKIVALADDLALNLAASDVRIEAPIPGKAAVGIEVPNKVIAPVYLREVLDDDLFRQASSPLTIGLGKDITGNPILADLMKMPHFLIAGSTGSGKSVCINALIASILFKARPEEAKFVMIDPKVVELSTFNGIPHLLMPVVTDPKRASLALKNMLKEMGRRYELFARESVRDINGFNDRKRQLNEETELLPYIVVIIDELADLMMVAAADVEDSIARLAQMSRAAGIHLVIATQRPSVDVITGVIKANITSRIAFAVSSQADSRTILDMGGAEKLLGRGDALFHPVGVSKPYRVQGAFINERELTELLGFIKGQGEPQYQEQMLPEEEEENDWYEEDELFPEAVMLVAQAETASISMLQRRLRIGYTRAARLIDDMERRGFVGRFEGSKAREVMITADQVSKLLMDENSDNPTM